MGLKSFTRSESSASGVLVVDEVPTDASFDRTPATGTIVLVDNGDGTGTLHIRMSDGTWGTVAVV